jgi:hypothetical protein
MVASQFCPTVHTDTGNDERAISDRRDNPEEQRSGNVAQTATYRLILRPATVPVAVSDGAFDLYDRRAHVAQVLPSCWALHRCGPLHHHHSLQRAIGRASAAFPNGPSAGPVGRAIGRLLRRRRAAHVAGNGSEPRLGGRHRHARRTLGSRALASVDPPFRAQSTPAHCCSAMRGFDTPPWF